MLIDARVDYVWFVLEFSVVDLKTKWVSNSFLTKLQLWINTI